MGGGGVFVVVIAFEALAEFSDLNADGGVDAGIVVLRLVHDVSPDGIFLKGPTTTGEVGVSEVAEEAPESFRGAEAFASEYALEFLLKFGVINVWC